MKQLLLALIVLSFSTSVVAEWKVFIKVDSVTYYIDTEHVRRDGNLVKLWELQDYPSPHNKGVQSMRAQLEYDCKEEMNRLLYLSQHTGHMAGGTTLSSDSIDGKWNHIAPGTAEMEVLRFLCAKYAK